LLARHFGKSSEKLDPGQLELVLEAMEEMAAAGPAQDGSTGEPPAKDKTKDKKTFRNKRAFFPDKMVTREVVIELPEEERLCRTTGKPLKFIRFETSTKYDYISGYFECAIIKRAVYASTAGEADALPDQPVVTVGMPAWFNVIPGCMAATGLLVYIIVSKYCDHIPLYRLQNIFKRRHGVEIDRNTMCHWLKRCAVILGMLYEEIRRELVERDYVQCDETFVKLIDPDRPGEARKSNFWVLKAPGIGVLFQFSKGRGHEVPKAMLEGFRGRLQSDGYGVYQTLLGKLAGITPFYCWAHVRRKFHESLEANGVGAAWYIAEIRRLYKVEEEARVAGIDAPARAALRMEKSAPVLERIKTRLDRDLGNADILPSSPLGKAIRYALPLWAGLTRYAEESHGMVEIDNNQVENAIRPTAVGKKNWLFIGHPNAGQMSAIIYTIVENCRMWDIDPMEYLRDVLPRIMDHPAARIRELLPRQWKQARAAA
jgi:transposase